MGGQVRPRGVRQAQVGEVRSNNEKEDETKGCLFVSSSFSLLKEGGERARAQKRRRKGAGEERRVRTKNSPLKIKKTQILNKLNFTKFRRCYISVDALQGHLAANGAAPYPASKAAKLLAGLDDVEGAFEQGAVERKVKILMPSFSFLNAFFFFFRSAFHAPHDESSPCQQSQKNNKVFFLSEVGALAG